MHSIPDIHGRIQAIAFGPRGTADLLAEASKPAVPAIIGCLPLVAALENRTDDENKLLREMCETIITSQWDWPYESGGSSKSLALATLPTLPAPAAPEVTPPVPAPAPPAEPADQEA